MSSRGGAAQKPLDQDEKEEEEDFYDCQETPYLREEEEGKKETQQEAGGSQDFQTKTETLTNRRDSTESETAGLHQEEERSDSPQEEERSDSPQEEEHVDRPQEEERSNSPQEEEQGNRLQEYSDSDLKEDNSRGIEFDDDYLREVEKDLTEEEKESRRQQSLTLKEQGNKQFKAGDWSEAERSYTEALGLCPVGFSRQRAVLFSNRAAARLHLDLKDQAISDCTRAIELDPDYLRALLRRAELYEQTEKLDEALEDYKQVLERDPNQTSARQACMRLPQQIQERNEKLKEEMISKLKDLGNMILRPFGLSTNNFQVNQDQGTGSYSINFVQNPNNNNNR